MPSPLGGLKLTDIRRAKVNLWVADLTKAGRGAVTVRRALATLQMIFIQAARDEIISTSPALLIDKLAVPNGDAPVKVWEPAYTKEFFERCSRHRLGALFEVTADTGLRRGEITVCTGRMLILTTARSPSGITVSAWTVGCSSRPTRKPVQDAGLCL